MVKAFYDDGQVKLHQGDVLAWALDYKARIDRGEALRSCRLVSASALR